MQNEAESIINSIHSYTEFLFSIFSEPLISKIIYTGVTIILGIITIRIIGFALRRLVVKNIISRPAYDKLYSIISLAGYLFIIVILLAIITESPVMLYALAGILIVVFISSYDVIANVIAYYAIILGRPIIVGSTVTIDDATGKIRDINALYTEIKCDTGDIIKIPNREIFRKKILIHGVTHPVSVMITLKGMKDIREAEKLVKTAIQEFKDAIITSKPDLYISKATNDKVEFKLTVYISSIERSSYVKTELSRKLYEKLKDVIEEVRVT